MKMKRAYDPTQTGPNLVRLANMQGLKTNRQQMHYFRVTSTTIDNWKSGKKAPSIDKMVEFCGEFGYSLDDVVVYTEFEEYEEY